MNEKEIERIAKKVVEQMLDEHSDDVKRTSKHSRGKKKPKNYRVIKKKKRLIARISRQKNRRQ